MKLTCLLTDHHLNLLERGFEVYKKTNTKKWIKRTYRYNPSDERLYWNSQKIFSKYNYFYPFEIREIHKISDLFIHLELSMYLPRHKYDKIEIIYKSIEWKFRTEEDRNEIFIAIQEIISQYHFPYSIFHKC